MLLKQTNWKIRTGMASLIIGAVLALGVLPASAHCDTMDGPVITAAQKALDENNVNLILIWVQPDDEAEIRKAFMEARRGREKYPEHKEEIDRAFFETLVQVHRAGEGASFEGIKPAGTETNPAVAKADEAIASADPTLVAGFVSEAVAEQIHAQFREVIEKKNFDPNNVEAGREYVNAYVNSVHYAEKMYEMAEATTAHQHHEEQTPSHDEELGDHHETLETSHEESTPWTVSFLLPGAALALGGLYMVQKSRR